MDQAHIINLGSVNNIPLGQGICFIIQEEEVAVFRSRNGKISAIENMCPHRQGPLSGGIIGDGKVICPLHGHKFDLTTGQGSEGHECVKVYKIWEQKGEIFLEWIPKKKLTGVHETISIH